MYQCDTHSLTHLPADQEEGTWYPREKIRSARKKLQGYNSAHVMLVDLENGHGKSQEFPFLKRMLMGDRKLNTRAKVRGGGKGGCGLWVWYVDIAHEPRLGGRGRRVGVCGCGRNKHTSQG